MTWRQHSSRWLGNALHFGRGFGKFCRLDSEVLTDWCNASEEVGCAQARRLTRRAQLRDIYKGAPSTNYRADKRAQEALQKMEDMTFSEAEINAFLPKELKRGK